ncbi:MAG: hypothetical protein WD069_20980 [Planctomycetales bacterium]
MIDSLELKAHFSPDISFQLILGDRVIPVWAIGPEEITLREPVALNPVEADLVMQVDDWTRVWKVFLVDGADPTRERVRIQPLDPTPH